MLTKQLVQGLDPKRRSPGETATEESIKNRRGA
jgi:hypothetical protein